MNLLSGFTSVPAITPAFNVGGGFDILTGAYYIGRWGQSILNGGLYSTVSIAGPANSFKSALIDYLHLTVCDRIKPYQLSKYCTENSSTYKRLQALCAKMPNMSKIDHSNEFLEPEEIKIRLTTIKEEMGDVYFSKMSKLSRFKASDKSIKRFTTPFRNAKGDPITMIQPTGLIIDSISAFMTTNVEEGMIANNNLGSSEQNTVWMRLGLAKKLLISELPGLCSRGSMFVGLTAHVGEEFELGGPMAPKKHKLTHAKKGTTMKGASKAFEYINTVLFEIQNVSLLNNKTYNTGVLYPANARDRGEETADLILIKLIAIRNKEGGSGNRLNVVVSQREGLLPHLTQFHHLKESKFFGLVGNDRNYALALLPDLPLSRTTVRNLIDNMPELRRALEITDELLQIKEYWDTPKDDLLCTPEELYNDIIALGYNWKTLLNTRGWWVFDEHLNDNLPELSTWDLLRIRKGLYKPYWLSRSWAKTEKPKGLLLDVLSQISEDEKYD